MAGALTTLRASRLSRLLVFRWSSQTSDGLFQSGLASFLLFSPERAPTALAIATGFAVVLLPYSLLGPLVGTILDRFDRRTVLIIGNLTRTLLLLWIALLVAAGTRESLLIPWVLLCFGISRLVLAGFSAGLPRLVPESVLVPANAIAVTGGTLAAVIGGGLGLGLRTLTSPWSNNHSDAAIIVLAALTYLLAAISGVRLRPGELGPHEHERPKTWAAGLIDLRLGLAHLRRTYPARWAILRIATIRGGMSALIVSVILLNRNVFTDNPDRAIVGLGAVVTSMGVGSLLGAAITSRATALLGRRRWMQINTLSASGLAVLYAFTQTPLLLPMTMSLIAMTGQAIKVSADAEVQLSIDDDYRGRVFAVYDMAVNVAIVIGSFVAAMTLVADQRTLLLPICIALLLVLMTTVDRLRRRPQTSR